MTEDVPPTAQTTALVPLCAETLPEARESGQDSGQDSGEESGEEFDQEALEETIEEAVEEAVEETGREVELPRFVVGGRPGPGRPKGSLNKVSLIAKQVIAEAAEGIGGVARLMAWIKEDDRNERLFWASVYPKLMPIQVRTEILTQAYATVVYRGLND